MRLVWSSSCGWGGGDNCPSPPAGTEVRTATCRAVTGGAMPLVVVVVALVIVVEVEV